MKILLFISVIVSFFHFGFVRAQISETVSANINKKDIYVLGTFHFREHDFAKYPQDINMEVKKAICYKPDIVCVEWMDKSEPLDIYNNDYSKNIRELRQQMKLDTVNAMHIVDSIYMEFSKKPKSINDRLKLANYLFITRDYINACYQWFIIENTIKDSIKLKELFPENISRYRFSLYNDPDNQKREIIDIAFPVAFSLGFEKIYSIDYRHDQAEYGQYITSFNQRFKAQYGYDPLQMKSEKVVNVFTTWLESDLINKKSTYYEKLNSKECEDLLFNYYFDMFVSYCYDSDYQKWHFLQLEKRNWVMFELLIKAINESEAKKTFVLVGVTHKIFIERYLYESGIFKVANKK